MDFPYEGDNTGRKPISDKTMTWEEYKAQKMSDFVRSGGVVSVSEDGIAHQWMQTGEADDKKAAEDWAWIQDISASVRDVAWAMAPGFFVSGVAAAVLWVVW